MIQGNEKRCTYARIVQDGITNHFVWTLWERMNKMTQHGAGRGMGSPADEFFKMARDVATLVQQMKQTHEAIGHIEGDICGEEGRPGLRQRVESLEKTRDEKILQFKVWKFVLTTIAMILSWAWGILMGLTPWVQSIFHALGWR